MPEGDDLRQEVGCAFAAQAQEYIDILGDHALLAIEEALTAFSGALGLLSGPDGAADFLEALADEVRACGDQPSRGHPPRKN